MADVDLRQLERAAAQGDAAAGERLLRERLRRQLIDAERVALAAWLGDPAAQAVRPDPPPEDWLACLDGLHRWGRAVAVRGALAVARWLAPPPVDDGPREVGLLVLEPERAQRSLAPGASAVVGRGRDADLRVNEDRVSRRHCELTHDAEGGIWVRDLGSKNGTWLGSESLGADPIRVFDGNLLRLGGATLEIRGRSGHRSQGCLDAVQAWLDDPSDAQASGIDVALSALDRSLSTPFDQAVRAAAHTALCDPPAPGYFLQRIPDLVPEEALQTVRRALLPLALGEHDLPRVPDPPVRLSRASWPRNDPRWRDHVEQIDRRLGLRAIHRQRRFPDDRRGPILCRAADGTERLVSVIDVDDQEDLVTAVRVLCLVSPGEFTHPRLVPFLGADEAHSPLLVASRPPPGPGLSAWAQQRPPTRRAVQLIRDVCEPAQVACEAFLRVPLSPDSVRVDPAGRGHLHGVVEEELHRQLPRWDHDPSPGLSALAHLSPEEATEAAAVQARPCSVYRLGSFLFLALTGRHAFLPTSAKVLLAILDEEPPAPSSLRPEVSPELDAVVLKALAKAPGDRYPDPLELEAALAATPEADGA